MTEVLESELNLLTRRRKADHLSISLNHEINHEEVTTGLENYDFIHEALPEINLSEIEMSTSLAGRRIEAPLIISSMTGGIEETALLNKNLARAAQHLGLAMGVGSQRSMIEDETAAHTYRIRDVAPDILLFANLGAVQLNNGFGLAECLRAVESIQADGLMLHLNPLQEALQFEGNTNFAGLWHKISEICLNMPVPVFVKEVGCGISRETALKLASAGVAGIDVAGAGGTSWGKIEAIRSNHHSRTTPFVHWGIPTADCLRMTREAAPGVSLIASGGIRTGVDVAKVIALGADAAGIAAPVLKPAYRSAQDVIEVLEQIIRDLKIAMFCTGSKNITGLKTAKLIFKGRGK